MAKNIKFKLVPRYYEYTLWCEENNVPVELTAEQWSQMMDFLKQY